MIATVVRGDVVKAERARISSIQKHSDTFADISYELWISLRARVANRTVSEEEKYIDSEYYYRLLIHRTPLRMSRPR